MQLIPISYYPMPSDDKSQIQVLGERKSELAGQAQAIEQSPMSGRQKQQALAEVNEEISAVRVGIRHRQADRDIKHQAENQRAGRKQYESHRLEQERLARSDAGNAAERQSADEAGALKRKKTQLDIRA